MTSKSFLIRLLALVFCIFLLNYLAMNFFWYSSVWYLDMVMHFLGGFWLGLAFFWFLKPKEISSKFIFKIILGVLLIGILWEIFEIAVDETTIGEPFNILDTASDIFFDLAGGFSAGLYYFKKVAPIGENTTSQLRAVIILKH